MLRISTLALGALLICGLRVMAQQPSVDAKTLERGRYITIITGCNDCHTPGYAETGGATPAEQWLTGGGLGFRGPWGTTYPTNLRLYFDNLTEDQWVQKAKTLRSRP